MSKLVYFVINLQFLFNVSIRTRDVSLRLIVIIIRHKIFHSVVRKKLTQLIAKLSSESFVVCDNNGGLVNFFNDICHCKSFSRTCHAKQNLRFKSVQHTISQRFYCLWLISTRFILTYQLKFIHSLIPKYKLISLKQLYQLSSN